MTQIEFNEQINMNQTPLKGFALKLTRNMDDALDLVQETLLKALLNRDKFEDGTNLKGWMYTIMRNLFINQYRRKSRSKITHDDSDNQYLLNSAVNYIGNKGESNMIIREVENAISDLPVNLKSPFMLAYLGYKYEEISEIENVPLGTVKIRIHTARKRLKERLPEYDYHNAIAA